MFFSGPGCPTFLRFLAVPKKESISSKDSYPHHFKNHLVFELKPWLAYNYTHCRR